MDDAARDAAVERMRAAGMDEPAVRTFLHAWEQVRDGATGIIDESTIEPVGDLPRLTDLPVDAAADRDAAARVVVIRLNGGLGTSMGLRGPKSLLVAKDGRTFLDVIAMQVLAARERLGAQVPLVLMDSFATRDASRAALGDWPDLAVEGLALDFLQHQQPKVLVDTLEPVDWPAEPDHEWCPPGHGDLYPALLGSGMLDALLERGMTHAFVANSDNLGATLDPRVASWMQRESVPFVMEVAERTEADRKGGHLARRRSDGHLVLRESAQTAEHDRAALADLTRHRYMNTNNLWVDLRVLREVLVANDGVLGLPLIRNAKTVDPTDPSSPAVYQFETAMGSAIERFDGAQALLVDRTRFAPVKGTDELFVLRSDAYRLHEDGTVELAAERRGNAPVVTLDPRWFRMLDDFEARLPGGPPSMLACDRLTVHGDVRIDADVELRGEVTIGSPEA